MDSNLYQRRIARESQVQNCVLRCWRNQGNITELNALMNDIDIANDIGRVLYKMVLKECREVKKENNLYKNKPSIKFK